MNYTSTEIATHLATITENVMTSVELVSPPRTPLQKKLSKKYSKADESYFNQQEFDALPIYEYSEVGWEGSAEELALFLLIGGC